MGSHRGADELQAFAIGVQALDRTRVEEVDLVEAEAPAGKRAKNTSQVRGGLAVGHVQDEHPLPPVRPRVDVG